MITGETITDEQIRALMEWPVAAVQKACRAALGLYSRGGAAAQRRARSNCAQLFAVLELRTTSYRQYDELLHRDPVKVDTIAGLGFIKYHCDVVLGLRSAHRDGSKERSLDFLITLLEKLERTT